MVVWAQARLRRHRTRRCNWGRYPRNEDPGIVKLSSCFSHHPLSESEFVAVACQVGAAQYVLVHSISNAAIAIPLHEALGIDH